MSKYKDQDLAEIVSEGNFAKLIEIDALNKSKKSTFTFKDGVKDLSAEDIKKLCDDINTLVMKHTESIFENTDNLKSPSRKKMGDINLLVQAAINLTQAVLARDESALLEIPEGIVRMVVFLNGIILEIPKSMDNLKNTIASFCEKVYHMSSVHQNQYFIFNTIIYLLIRSLNMKAAKKEVKRVYALRSTIPKILDIEPVDSSEVWALLKRCAASPLYLSMMEGQKVIAMALSIDADHVLEIHQVIMKCLPACTIKQGSAYGKVYFEAWSNAVKTNSAKLQKLLELACLQDIVMLAIQGKQRSSFLALRKLLGQFHSQKKDICVAKMLNFLYEPILWRYCKDPDGLIRSHAAQIFLDVFPLEDPDIKVVETDIELNNQMLLIKDLLEDEFPVVRSTAIVGLCISMSVNWELFPTAMLTTYFKIIVNDLSHDSSSIDVRCAVAKGFKVLLENPLTIETLKNVLPKLQHLFHDIADSVRVAFCQLLLRVKKISAIKYYEIVPLDHLLARLEVDPVLGKPIVNLIHNSYFPKGFGPEVWFARCCELIKTDRDASRVFFTHVSCYVGVEAAVKFMVQVIKSIHFYVRSKHSTSNPKKKKSSGDASNSDNVSAEETAAFEEVAGFKDPNVISGLLDSVAILWLSVIPDLEDAVNKNFLKLLVGNLSKCLGDLVVYYKATPAWSSVFYLSSLLPTSNLPILAGLCFEKLLSLPAGASPTDYITLLDCLCNQDEGVRLLDLVSEWVGAGLAPHPEDERSPAPKKGRKSTKPKPSLPDGINKLLAVQMLHQIIDRRPCQKPLLSRNPDSLSQFLQLTQEVQKKIEFSIENRPEKEETDFLIELQFAQMKIASLLHGSDKYNAVKFIEDLMLWVQDKFLKQMMSEPENADLSCSRVLTENFSHLDISTANTSRRRSSSRKSLRRTFTNCNDETRDEIVFTICKNLCVVAGDLTTLGFCKTKVLKFLKFASCLINIENGGPLLLNVSKLLYKQIVYGNILHVNDSDLSILQLIPDCYMKIIHRLRNETYLKSIPASDIREMQGILSNCVLALQQQGSLKELSSDLMFAVAKSFLGGIHDSIKDCDTLMEKCGSFNKMSLSKSSAFIFSTMCIKPKLLVFFLQQLQKYLKTGRDIKSWVFCYVIIGQICEMKSLSKNVYKEMGTILNNMGDILHEQFPQKDSHALIESLTDDFAKDMSTEIRFGNHCYVEFKTLKDLVKQKMNPHIQKRKPRKNKDMEVD